MRSSTRGTYHSVTNKYSIRLFFYEFAHLLGDIQRADVAEVLIMSPRGGEKYVLLTRPGLETVRVDVSSVARSLDLWIFQYSTTPYAALKRCQQHQ